MKNKISDENETEAKSSPPPSLKNGLLPSTKESKNNLKKSCDLDTDDQSSSPTDSAAAMKSANKAEAAESLESPKTNGTSLSPNNSEENEANMNSEKAVSEDNNVKGNGIFTKSLETEDNCLPSDVLNSTNTLKPTSLEKTDSRGDSKEASEKIHSSNENSTQESSKSADVKDSTENKLEELKDKGDLKEDTLNSTINEELPQGSPLSETSSHLALEESLLKGGDNDPPDDPEEDIILEEKLLEDVDLEKDENYLLSQVEKTLESDLKRARKGKEREVLSDKANEDSEESNQQKEIEKILKNLDNSLKNSKTEENISTDKKESTSNSTNSNASIKIGKGSNSNSAKGSISANFASEIKKDDAKSLPLPESLDCSKSEKRSLPAHFIDDSDKKPKKVPKASNSESEKHNLSEGSSSKSVDGKESVETKKEGNTSKKASNSNALTFSEALKCIEMENPLFIDQPQPLKPTAEISTDEIPKESSSLTVLSSLSEGNAKQKDSEGTSLTSKEIQRKKRPFQEEPSLQTSKRPDLKKVRIFKKAEDPSSTKTNSDTDLEPASMVKQMEQTQAMESRLQEEKSRQVAQGDSEELDKRSLQFTDKEDLQRRTALEMRNAGLTNKKLKRIKRKDLESLVIELFVDKVLYEHQLGQQKDLCKRLEGTLEANRKKAAQFHKEIEDLKKVTQRLQVEHAARKNHIVAPVKVKRSVGIQATPTIIGKGLMHASTFSNIRVLSPSSGCTSQVRQVTDPIQTSTNQPTSSSPTSASTPNIVNPQPSSNVVSPPTARAHDTSQTQSSSTPQTTVPSSGSTTPHMVMLNPLVLQQQNQSAAAAASASASASASAASRLGGKSPSSSALNSGTSASSQAPPSSQGNSALSKTSNNTFIDLTDDDDAAKNARVAANVAPGGILATIPKPPGIGVNSSATAGQFVALNPPSKLVFVPSTLGQPTTALVVGSANSSNQVLSTGITRSTSAVIPAASTVRFSTSPGSTIVNTSRVLVGAQMNGNSFVAQLSRHPAPLPRAPPQQTSGYSKKLPPVPILKLSHKDNKGIVLSWNMAKTDEHESIASYQLYAYQEGTSPPSPTLWKKVGSVKALELPMACTLTQFMPGHIYHFAVRAVDIRSRLGPFSDPRSIQLRKQD